MIITSIFKTKKSGVNVTLNALIGIILFAILFFFVFLRLYSCTSFFSSPRQAVDDFTEAFLDAIYSPPGNTISLNYKLPEKHALVLFPPYADYINVKVLVAPSSPNAKYIPGYYYHASNVSLPFSNLSLFVPYPYPTYLSYNIYKPDICSLSSYCICTCELEKQQERQIKNKDSDILCNKAYCQKILDDTNILYFSLTSPDYNFNEYERHAKFEPMNFFYGIRDPLNSYYDERRFLMLATNEEVLKNNPTTTIYFHKVLDNLIIICDKPRLKTSNPEDKDACFNLVEYTAYIYPFKNYIVFLDDIKNDLLSYYSSINQNSYQNISNSLENAITYGGVSLKNGKSYNLYAYMAIVNKGNTKYLQHTNATIMLLRDSKQFGAFPSKVTILAILPFDYYMDGYDIGKSPKLFYIDANGNIFECDTKNKNILFRVSYIRSNKYVEYAGTFRDIKGPQLNINNVDISCDNNKKIKRGDKLELGIFNINNNYYLGFYKLEVQQQP